MDPINNSVNASPSGGGTEVEVTYLDGRKEFVRVRELPIKHMERYLQVFNDEAKAVELFCGKEAGWTDSLTPASHDALIEKGEGLNVPLFEGWYARQMRRVEVLNPGFAKNLAATMQRAAENAAAASASATSGSASPAAPASA